MNFADDVITANKCVLATLYQVTLSCWFILQQLKRAGAAVLHPHHLERGAFPPITRLGS